MYQIDELIDHIRDLENNSITHVYLLNVAGVNSSSEPFLWPTKSAVKLESLGKTRSQICDRVCEDIYDKGYCTYIKECCGGDEDCCGPIMSYEVYKEKYLRVHLASFGSDELSSHKTSIEKYGTWIATVTDNYEDCTHEITITYSEIIDA